MQLKFSNKLHFKVGYQIFTVKNIIISIRANLLRQLLVLCTVLNWVNFLWLLDIVFWKSLLLVLILWQIIKTYILFSNKLKLENWYTMATLWGNKTNKIIYSWLLFLSIIKAEFYEKEKKHISDKQKFCKSD